jgi:O-antigen/teichoic acid export membrane protein
MITPQLEENVNEGLEVGQVKGRIAKSFVALAVRNGVVALVTFGTTLVLGNVLSASDYGIYAIIQLFSTFFIFITEIGFGAMLIRKQSYPTPDELDTTFTLQLGVVSIVVVLLFLLAAPLATLFQLGSDGPAIFIWLALSLFFSSLGSVPGALLERNLQFGKLALVDVIEILAFSAVALPAAVWLKAGAWSFIAAVLVRSLITGFIFYFLQSWRPHLRLERVAAKEIFKFGVPYQLGILAAFFKDNMLALLIGPWLGPRTLGYLSFGFEQAKLPYMLSQMVARITFPAFARLQEDRAFLQRSLEWTIKLSFITCGAYTVITSILAPRLLVQVFGEKWEPAVLVYILLAGNFLGNYFTNPLVPLLTALGKPGRGMRLMLIWTVTMWLLTFLLVALFGYIGAAIASSVVTLFAAGAAVIEVRRLVQFSLWKALSVPLLALLPTGLLCLLLLPFLTNLWLTLTALFGAGLLYLGSVIGLDRATLLPEIKKILKKKF